MKPLKLFFEVEVDSPAWDFKALHGSPLDPVANASALSLRINEPDILHPHVQVILNQSLHFGIRVIRRQHLDYDQWRVNEHFGPLSRWIDDDIGQAHAGFRNTSANSETHLYSPLVRMIQEPSADKCSKSSVFAICHSTLSQLTVNVLKVRPEAFLEVTDDLAIFLDLRAMMI